MRKIDLIATALFLTVAAAAWAQAPTTKPATQPAADAMVNKFCAVVPGDPVDPTVFIMHEGKKIGFCCSDCIDEFKKEPAKYLKNMK